MKKITKKEIIKKFIKKSDEWKTIFGKEYPSNLAIESLFYELSNSGLIDFDVYFREGNSDSWLQAEYYNKFIKKVIIIDYNVNDNYENIDEIINTIEDLEKEIKKINKLIKK